LAVLGTAYGIAASYEEPDDAYDRGYRAGVEETEKRAKKLCVEGLKHALDYQEEKRPNR